MHLKLHGEKNESRGTPSVPLYYCRSSAPMTFMLHLTTQSFAFCREDFDCGYVLLEEMTFGEGNIMMTLLFSNQIMSFDLP